MNEREAWLFIAGSFRDKALDGDVCVHELPNGSFIQSFGMCHLINKMKTCEVISKPVWERLRAKICAALNTAGNPSFLFDCSLEGNNHRANFCTRHAECLMEGS